MTAIVVAFIGGAVLNGGLFMLALTAKQSQCKQSQFNNKEKNR